MLDVVKLTEHSKDEIALIKNTVAKNTTDLELVHFLKVAKGLNLNPLIKEIWCYKDNKNNLIMFAGRDGFLTIAQRDSKYNGIRSSEVCESDEFELDIANNKITHKIKAGERGKIIGAYSIVFVKDSEPTIEWAAFARYNKGFHTWISHPEEMIKKVSEVHALKKAFGIHGLYCEEEMSVKDGKVIDSEVVGLDEKTGKEIAEINSIEKLKEYHQKNKGKGKEFDKLIISRKNEIVEAQETERETETPETKPDRSMGECPKKGDTILIKISEDKPYQNALVENTSDCKTCGVKICWIKTESGELSPCSFLTKCGRDSLQVWQSHFADCPQADKHRKKTAPKTPPTKEEIEKDLEDSGVAKKTEICKKCGAPDFGKHEPDCPNLKK